MSELIETEITDSLQQMSQLQYKIEVLQQEKNNKVAEEVIEQNTTGPNLSIMSNWLNKYGEAIDEIERERVIVEQYNNYKHIKNDISRKVRRYEFMLDMVSVLNDPDTSSQDRDTQYKKARNRGIHVTIYQDISKLLAEYEPTKEEYKLYNNKEVIKERYLSLRQKMYSDIEYRRNRDTRTKLLNNSPTFVSRDNIEPTYFMKQYIEAINNMFLIQQKRIIELEKKIEEFYPKLLNDNFEYDIEDRLVNIKRSVI